MGLYLSSVLHRLSAHQSSNFQCQTHTTLLTQIVDLSVMYAKICEIRMHQNGEALPSGSICPRALPKTENLSYKLTVTSTAENALIILFLK